MEQNLYEIILEHTGFRYSKDKEEYTDKDKYRFEVRKLKEVRKTAKGYVLNGANALYRNRLRDLEIDYVFTHQQSRPYQFILYTTNIEEGIIILKNKTRDILLEKLEDNRREDIMYHNLLEKVGSDYEIKEY